MSAYRDKNLAVLKGAAAEHGWSTVKDDHQEFVCERDGRRVTVNWSARGQITEWGLEIQGIGGYSYYNGKHRLDQAVALLNNKGRRHHLIKVRMDCWMLCDHMDPNWQGKTFTGPHTQKRAEAELRKLNHEDEQKAHAAILFSYTEVSHRVTVSAPADAAPMDMDGGWQIQPARVAMTFTLRSQSGPTWECRVELTGPWIQRADKPERVGTGNLVPWEEEHFPAWLTEMVQAHRPQWTPELPKAIITTPKRKDSA